MTMNGEPRVLASVWLPLQRAALCLDDETVFPVEDQACPMCGGETFVLLARWLQARQGGVHVRA